MNTERQFRDVHTFKNIVGDVLDIQVFGGLEKDGQTYLLVGERTAGALNGFDGDTISGDGSMTAGFMRVVSSPSDSVVILDGVSDKSLCTELHSLWASGGQVEIIEGEWTFPQGIIVEFADAMDRRFTLDVIGYTMHEGITYAMVSGKDLHSMFEGLEGITAIAVRLSESGGMELIDDDVIYDELVSRWHRDVT